MLTRSAARLLRLCTLLVLLVPALPGQVAATPPRQGAGGSLAVHHELTQRPEGSRFITSPILSGDGRRAIWTESPPDPHPQAANRLFALDLDVGQPVEIDAYQPLCGCHTRVDVSDDGNTVVSTDGVRLRLHPGVATLGRPREVLRLADDAIGALRISGDGSIVVFVVLRDTTVSEPDPSKHGAPIPRGVWALDAEGERIHLAGVEQVAAAAGVPESELEAHPDFVTPEAINALDVSDDGSRIVFGARAGNAGEAVFSLTAGAPLSKLAEPVPRVIRTAVSGDGRTVAWLDGSPSSGGWTNVTRDGVQGRTLQALTSQFPLDWSERLQLSRDGSTLLGSGEGGAVLVDMATPTARQLISNFDKSITDFDTQRIPRLFTGAAATMNGAGTRVLYVVRSSTSKLHNLAVIELGTTDLGGAPLIREVHVAPDTIPPDGSQSATVTAEVAWDGALIEVWLGISSHAPRDVTFGPWFDEVMQEGPVSDPGRLQGVFTAPIETRWTGDRPGPRPLRIVSESQTEDGRRHGTVLETDKTVTVGDVGLRIFRTEQAQPSVAAWVVPYWWESMPAWQAEWEVPRFHAEIQVDSSGRVSGGSLTIEAVNSAAQARDYLEDYHVTFEGTAGAGSAITPWTDISFSGMRLIQAQGTDDRRDDTYSVTLMVALNDTGQLVMCDQQAHVSVDTPEQARQNCMAQALATLQPVGSSPSPPLA